MTASTTSLTTSLQVPQAPALRTARDSFWTRIAAELAEAIGSGVYPPGQRLPSEHALAEQFGVNRHTIRRSLASLCSQGLVRITQGSGTYVEDFAVDLVLGKRTRHQQGLALRVRGDAEGQPLHISERYFPLPRFENLAAVVRETGSITAGFTAHGVADYTRRESRITAELPSAEVAAQLRQPTSRPVLQVESLNVDLAGTPIEWARAWFAGDRVKLTIDHNEHA